MYRFYNIKGQTVCSPPCAVHSRAFKFMTTVESDVKDHAWALIVYWKLYPEIEKYGSCFDLICSVCSTCCEKNLLAWIIIRVSRALAFPSILHSQVYLLSMQHICIHFVSDQRSYWQSSKQMNSFRNIYANGIKYVYSVLWIQRVRLLWTNREIRSSSIMGYVHLPVHS